MKWLINTLRAWFTKPDPPDVPEFVVCTCVKATIPAWTNTADGTVVDITQSTSVIRNVKCPVHSAAGRQT